MHLIRTSSTGKGGGLDFEHSVTTFPVVSLRWIWDWGTLFLGLEERYMDFIPSLTTNERYLMYVVYVGDT